VDTEARREEAADRASESDTATPAMSEVVTAEESLSEKVDRLRDQLATISEQAESQRRLRPEEYLQALETLRQHVDAIQAEWETVAAQTRAQREQLESLLQAFPGAIETSTLRALALRVTHLESLVSELVEERESKDNSSRARKQMIISLVALAVTVVLWGVWIVVSVTQ